MFAVVPPKRNFSPVYTTIPSRVLSRFTVSEGAPARPQTGEIRSESDKILRDILWPPENIVGHIERATYSAGQNRNVFYRDKIVLSLGNIILKLLYYSKVIKQFYFFINCT